MTHPLNKDETLRLVHLTVARDALQRFSTAVWVATQYGAKLPLPSDIDMQNLERAIDRQRQALIDRL